MGIIDIPGEQFNLAGKEATSSLSHPCVILEMTIATSQEGVTIPRLLRGGRGTWGGSGAWGEPPIQPRVPSTGLSPLWWHQPQHRGSQPHPRLPQQQDVRGQGSACRGGRSFPALVPLLQESETLANGAHWQELKVNV